MNKITKEIEMPEENESDEENEKVYEKNNPVVPEKGSEIDVPIIVVKYKKFFISLVDIFTNEYIKIVRPDNNKKIMIDPHSKKQITYMIQNILNMVSKIKSNPPADGKIHDWIDESLKVNTMEYKVYNFLYGIRKNSVYSCMGEDIEESTLGIIMNYIDRETVMQHLAEIIIIFIKKFSMAIANFSWNSTKKINAKITNSILRNMDTNNTNPIMFTNVYNYTESAVYSSKKD